MSVLGSIEIQMLADLARLKKDMDEAKGIVGGAVRGIQNIAGGALKALGALGIGLSAAGLAGWVKNAIDAADATDDLSQRMGVAVKDVAGLQLAFKFAGVEGGVMSSSMVRLSRNVVENGEMFERMGVSVRKADGTLKDSRQVLHDVADVFQAMPVGIERTALATEVFGKAGADLMPMLAGGSEGLRALDDMAARLGMTLDAETTAAAGEFNDTLDLLGMAGEGMGRKIAAQLLPTLNSLAGGLLDSATQGDGLRMATDALAAGLKGLLSIVIGVAGGVGAIGTAIGGVAAAAMAVASGDFRGAAAIAKEAWADTGNIIKTTGQNISKVWSDAGGQQVAQAARMVSAQRQITVASKDQQAASKGAATEAKKHAAELQKLSDAGLDYVRDLKAKNNATQQEIDLGRELTEGEKQLLALQKDLSDGKKVMTAETRRLAEEEIRRGQNMRDLRRQQEDYAKTLQAVAQHTRKAADEEARTTEQMRGNNLALIEQAEKLRLGEQAWEARERAVMLNQAADLEWQAANQGGNYQLEEQARLLRERAALLADGAAVKEAKAVADEWSKTTDSIYNGLTDSIFRGLEAGRDFFSVFWQGIKNTVKTTVLQPAIKYVVQGALGTVGGALGLPAMGATGAAGAGAQAAGGIGSLLSGLGGLGGMAGAFGGGASYGLAGLLGGNIGSTMGGISALFGSGSMSMGLGAVAGMAGPVALGLMALRSLSTKSTPHMGGFAAINSDGMLNAAFGAGESNRSSNLDNSVIGLMRSITGTLNSTAGAFGQDANFAGTGVFKSDGRDGSFGVLELLRGVSQVGGFRADGTLAANSEAGFTEFSNRAALSVRDALTAMDLPQWASDVLRELGDSPGLDDLVKTAAAISDTARALDAMGMEVEPLGGVFATIAGLSSDAKFQLAEFAGGIDNFLALTRSYVDNYFSDDEKMALSARKILEDLRAAGIDGSGATAKADLRTAIESTNPNTEEGRRQLAALLSVAQEYVAVGQFLEANGRTLGDLASGAPMVTALEGLLDPSEATAEATQATADSVSTVAAEAPKQTEALASIKEEARANVTATSEGLQSVIEQLQVLNAAVARMLGNTDQQLNAGKAGGG